MNIQGPGGILTQGLGDISIWGANEYEPLDDGQIEMWFCRSPLDSIQGVNCTWVNLYTNHDPQCAFNNGSNKDLCFLARYLLEIYPDGFDPIRGIVLPGNQASLLEEIFHVENDLFIRFTMGWITITMHSRQIL